MANVHTAWSVYSVNPRRKGIAGCDMMPGPLDRVSEPAGLATSLPSYISHMIIRSTFLFLPSPSLPHPFLPPPPFPHLFLSWAGSLFFILRFPVVFFAKRLGRYFYPCVTKPFTSHTKKRTLFFFDYQQPSRCVSHLHLPPPLWVLRPS